jgi:toxin CcdB
VGGKERSSFGEASLVLMARLSLHRNRDGSGYLLDVQADILKSLSSRLVIPVLPLDQAPPPAGKLNPLVTVDGVVHSVVTQHMAAVSTKLLGDVAVSMEQRDTEIIGAIDLLISGV